MPERNDEWISKRAYALWEEEGRPDGRHSDHWNTALAEYEAMLEASRQTTENADRRIAMAKARLSDDEVPSLDAPSPASSKGGKAS